MKIMVTGAAGYIGTVLVRTLAESGYEVCALVLPTDNIEPILPYARIVQGDVCDLGSLQRAFAGMDRAVHLAGIIDIGSGNKALMRRVNVEGTRNVIRACQDQRVGRLVYASSVHAIPERPDAQEMVEVDCFDPGAVVGDYAKTKAEATAAVLSACREGLDAVVVHPSGVIGPYERRPSNIGTMITEFLCGRLTAYPAGAYSFVDVRDVAKGILLAMEKGGRGECYILAGHVVTVEQMIQAVSAASGKKMLRTRLPKWFLMPVSGLAEWYYRARHQSPLFTRYSIQVLFSNCHFSSAKAQRQLGATFRPFEDSLRDMTNWIMAHCVEETGRKYRPYRRCAFHA